MWLQTRKNVRLATLRSISASAMISISLWRSCSLLDVYALFLTICFSKHTHKTKISDFKLQGFIQPSPLQCSIFYTFRNRYEIWPPSCSVPLVPHHNSSILSLIGLTGNTVKHQQKTDGLFYLFHTHTYTETWTHRSACCCLLKGLIMEWATQPEWK